MNLIEKRIRSAYHRGILEGRNEVCEHMNKWLTKIDVARKKQHAECVKDIERKKETIELTKRTIEQNAKTIDSYKQKMEEHKL